MASNNSLRVVEGQLVARILDALPTGFTLAKIKLPNAPFITPSDKWIRLTINGGAVEFLDAIGGAEITTGIFTVDIFYAIGTGTVASLNTAKIVKDLYNGHRFDDLVVTKTEVVPRGEDGNWWHTQVNIYFEFQTYDLTLNPT